VFGVLRTQDTDRNDSLDAEQISLERAAIFDASPNRLRAINLAGIGRDLIFPALGPGQLEAAAVTFEEAIKVDSSYFGGYAGIAQVQATVALLSPSPELAAQAMERANESVLVALQLAPKEAWSQLAMAWVNFADGEFEQAIQRSVRAVGLKPNDPHIIEFDALISLYSGNFERVIAESRRLELSLNGKTGFVFRNAAGSAQYHLGNYTGTIETFEKAIEAGAPVGPATVAYLMAANVRLGRHSRAKILAEQYTESWPKARIDLLLRKLFEDPLYAEDVISAMIEAGWSPPQ
jgi:tetratricopeptide (TPR) repeat protein